MEAVCAGVREWGGGLFRLDHDSATVGHCIPGVHTQIEQYLLDASGVSKHVDVVFGWSNRNGNLCTDDGLQ